MVADILVGDIEPEWKVDGFGLRGEQIEPSDDDDLVWDTDVWTRLNQEQDAIPGIGGGACCFFDGFCFSDPTFTEQDCINSSGTWVPGGTCEPNTCPNFSVCCQAGLRITATFNPSTYCLDITALECNVEFTETVPFADGSLTVRLTPTFGGIANFEITYSDGVDGGHFCHFFDATADCISGPGCFSCSGTGGRSICAALNRIPPYCP